MEKVSFEYQLFIDGNMCVWESGKTLYSLEELQSKLLIENEDNMLSGIDLWYSNGYYTYEQNLVNEQLINFLKHYNYNGLLKDFLMSNQNELNFKIDKNVIGKILIEKF